MNKRKNWIIVLLEVLAAAALAYVGSRYRDGQDDYDDPYRE